MARLARTLLSHLAETCRWHLAADWAVSLSTLVLRNNNLKLSLFLLKRSINPSTVCEESLITSLPNSNAFISSVTYRSVIAAPHAVPRRSYLTVKAVRRPILLPIPIISHRNYGGRERERAGLCGGHALRSNVSDSANPTHNQSSSGEKRTACVDLTSSSLC